MEEAKQKKLIARVFTVYWNSETPDDEEYEEYDSVEEFIELSKKERERNGPSWTGPVGDLLKMGASCVDIVADQDGWSVTVEVWIEGDTPRFTN